MFFAYAAVTPDSATLYIDRSKLGKNVEAHLGRSVEVRPYDDVFHDAAQMSKALATNDAMKPKKKILVSNRASWALYSALGGEQFVEEARSPIADEKAMKNETELIGMRNCHVRDGAALIQFFAWLEDQLVNKGNRLDEVQAADQLEAFRKQKNLFVGLSFPTISSTGANAAIIHYSPERGNCSVLDPNKVYLSDSGAQYMDGTTDTTRTVHYGQPTAAEIEAYTLVLKGNIALEKIKFPKGTSGFALDVLARQYLWGVGLDYRHGTGHGVGSFLVSLSGGYWY